MQHCFVNIIIVISHFKKSVNTNTYGSQEFQNVVHHFVPLNLREEITTLSRFQIIETHRKNQIFYISVNIKDPN